MQLREKALALVVALGAMLAATSALASIPRSDILAPAIERFPFENAPPAHPEASEVLPLVDHLRSAADASWPRESLLKTRVSDFDFAKPLLPQAEPQLSRALRQGYERLEREKASGDEYQDSSNLYAFAGGDPVNHRDPTGQSMLDMKAVIEGAKEIGRAVKNVAIGIRDTAVDYASAIYNPKPTLEALPQFAEDLQDPLLGKSPDDRYMRLKANELGEQVETFVHASGDQQQQMIGGGMLHTVVAVAPAAKGFGIGAVETATPVPMWQDYLTAARQRAAATRAGLGIADDVADNLVGMAIHRDLFFTAHPELRGKVWVHHAIEKQAITKHYPGLFAADEIEVLANYRGIPTGINSEIHLSKIRLEWNEFYRAHPWATREQVLGKVADIDAKYGYLFNPKLE